MRIALVHDYLAQDGGAERVLKAFHEVWPDAPIFVLFHDKEKIKDFSDADIRESVLSKIPGGKKHFQWLLPWMPLATEKLNLADFDLVLSTSSIFAKGVITSPDTLHISYCHTPPRFLWADTHNYIDDLNYGKMVKIFLPLLMSRQRLWDKMSADRVDHFIANSKTVQNRISKYYRRESDIIHPPVEIALCPRNGAVGNYYVAGGRLVPYKRLDLVVQVFNRLRTPLKIFGDGPEEARLRHMAKPNIEFLGRISDQEKANLMSRARAFIHPQNEDFGITPVEAMAAGRPVIALAQGGATETVVAGESGQFFNKQTWESLFDTLLNFNHEAWDSNKIREHAATYSADKFKTAIKNYVETRYDEFKRGFKQQKLLKTV